VKTARLQISHHQGIFSLPGLGEDLPVGIEDQGVPRSYFVVIQAHSIGKDKKHAVVMSPGGEPAHQPLPPLGTAELGLYGLGILLPVPPQRWIYQAHAARTRCPAPPCLMGGKENLRAHEGVYAGVLEDVVVIADQDADSGPLGDVKHGITASRLHVGIDETVKLSVEGKLPVRHGDHIGVVELTLRGTLDEPRAQADVELPG